MPRDESQIKTRLEEVLEAIFCPIVGCWPLHGCRVDFFHDTDADAYVLEVWPVGIEESVDHKQNGHAVTDEGVLYELAEFDFTELGKVVPLEHFHFSQRQALFEIGWKEKGQELGLRVHIEPVETEGT